MKVRGLVAFVTAVFMVFSVMSSSAFASVTFTDQAEINKITWAKDAIMLMAEKGIITGRTDGKFAPNESIKKLDALIMAARIAGVNEESNKDDVNSAESIYAADLQDYKIYGKREVSFLLHKGILNVAELDSYVGANSQFASMLRYETAILLVKVLGKESEVKNNTDYLLPFTDQTNIPDRAKPYVYYLQQNNIMNGTSDTTFSPMVPVTRAQMALLLSKVMGNVGTTTPSDNNNPTTPTPTPSTTADSTVSGTLVNIDVSSNSVWVKGADSLERIYVLANVDIYIDGEEEDVNSLTRGMSVKLKLKAGTLFELDATTPKISNSVEGIITDIDSTINGKSITVQFEDETTKAYEVPMSVTVVREGKNVTLSAIEEDDSIRIDFTSENIIFLITCEPKEKEVTGTITEVNINAPVSIKVKDDSGNTQTYKITSDTTIRRDSSKVTIQEIRVGDKATVELEYNNAVSIKAEGKTSKVSGSIVEVIISKDPKITIIDEDDKQKTYMMAADTIVEIDGETKTFYDLRVGYDVTLKFDSDVVVKVLAYPVNEVMAFTGEIIDINTNAGIIIINITTSKDTTQKLQTLILPREGTIKVMNATTGDTTKLSSLEKGQKITAFGNMQSGAFVITSIVLSE